MNWQLFSSARQKGSPVLQVADMAHSNGGGGVGWGGVGGGAQLLMLGRGSLV